MGIVNAINRLFRKDPPSDQPPFRATDGHKVWIEGKWYVIPYRVKFSNVYTPSDDIPHYCWRSRSSDGYEREAALKKLVVCDLDALAAAYVLVALSDYVLQISTLPLQATEKTKTEMRKLVRVNPPLVRYLDAVAISYWNEYYRSAYDQYTAYPAYKFLQELKAG